MINWIYVQFLQKHKTVEPEESKLNKRFTCKSHNFHTLIKAKNLNQNTLSKNFFHGKKCRQRVNLIYS